MSDPDNAKEVVTDSVGHITPRIQDMPALYSAVNLKNRKTYHVLGIAMDCTNTNPTVNHAMVIYTDENHVGLYVRSRVEFEAKFSRLPKQ